MHQSSQIIFILPLMTGHLFWKATILGGFHTDGLVQDCSNSIANALELLLSCT